MFPEFEKIMIYDSEIFSDTLFNMNFHYDVNKRRRC